MDIVGSKRVFDRLGPLPLRTTTMMTTSNDNSSMNIVGSKRVFDRLGPPPPTSTSRTKIPKVFVCKHYREGNCARSPCNFLHPELPGGGGLRRSYSNSGEKRLCKNWDQGVCRLGDHCRFLHARSTDDQNVVTGIALPSCSKKRYTWSKDQSVNGQHTDREVEKMNTSKSSDDIDNCVDDQTFEKISKLSEGGAEITSNKALFDSGVLNGAALSGAGPEPCVPSTEKAQEMQVEVEGGVGQSSGSASILDGSSAPTTDEVLSSPAVNVAQFLTDSSVLISDSPDVPLDVDATTAHKEMQIEVEGGAGQTSGSGSIPVESSAPTTDEVLSSPAVNVAQFLTDSSVLISDSPNVPLDVDATTAHKEMQIEVISGQTVLQDALSDPNVSIVGMRAVPSPPRECKKRKTLPAGAGYSLPFGEETIGGGLWPPAYPDQLQSYGLRPTVKNMCSDWIQGKCTLGGNCRFLHAWFTGDCFNLLTKPEGHQNVVTRMALPSGSDKLYTESKNESVRVLDCQSGQHNTDGEIGKLNTSKIADNVDQEALFSSDVLTRAAGPEPYVPLTEKAQETSSFLALAQKRGNGKNVDGGAGQTSGIPVGSSAPTTEEVPSSPAVKVHKKDTEKDMQSEKKKDTPSSEPKVKENSTPKDGKVDGKEAKSKLKVEAANDVVVQTDKKESVQTTPGSVKPKKKVIRKVLRPKVVKKKDTVEAVALPDEKSGIEKEADVEKTAESDEMGVCLLTEKAQETLPFLALVQKGGNDQNVEGCAGQTSDSASIPVGSSAPTTEEVFSSPAVNGTKFLTDTSVLIVDSPNVPLDVNATTAHKEMQSVIISSQTVPQDALSDPKVSIVPLDVDVTTAHKEMQSEIISSQTVPHDALSDPKVSIVPLDVDATTAHKEMQSEIVSSQTVPQDALSDPKVSIVPMDVDAMTAHKEMQSEIISSQTVPQVALPDPNVSIVGMKAVSSPPTQHKKRKMCPAGAEFSVLSGEETYGEFVDKFAAVGKQVWNCLQKAKKEIYDLKAQNQILRASEYGKLMSLTQLQTAHVKLNADMKKVEQQNQKLQFDMKKVEQQNQKLQFDNDQLMTDNKKFQDELNRQHYTQCLKVAAKSNVPSKVSTISEVNGQPSLSYVKPCPTEASTLGDGADEQGRCICIRDLALDTNFGRLAKGLMKFGPIKRVGIHIECNNMSNGCFANVEFESAFSMKNLIKASPIEIGGRGFLAVAAEKSGGGTQNEVTRLEAEMKIKDDECPKVAAKSNDVPSNVSTISEVNGQPSLSYVKPCATEASTLGDGADEQGRSIWVRNLGLDANFGQLAKQLKKFGTIKRVGIHIACDNMSKCCFADVEFANAFSAKNAIKASPIKFGGKTVGSLGVIEEKRGTGGTQN